MRGPLTLLVLALAGTLVGGWVGRSQSSDAWAELSRLHVIWTCAVGWAVGLVLGIIAAWLAARRFRPAGTRGARWRGALGTTAVAVALAPMALWVTVAWQDGLMREAAPVHRLLGERRPNVILISIDALRPDFLGAYGSTAGLTPNLDAFAAEATRYDASYAPAPWTLATFGALFAGKEPSRSIAMRQVGEHPKVYVGRARLLESVRLLPERLWSAGYRTAAELTNPFLTENFGWGRGFDHFRNEDAADPDLLLSSSTARADAVTKHADAWLRLNHYEPFLLWVHYLDPHTPYDAPAAPDQTTEGYPSEWETSRSYWEEHLKEAPLDVQERYARFCRERYAAEVRYVDEWVGRLLDRIRESGRYDDSLIAVFADHGEEFLEHGGFEHGHSLHEEVLRVPLIVKWPRGFRADPVVHQTVALMQLTYTVLEVAGCEPLEGDARASLPRVEGVPGAEVYSEGLLHSDRQTALTTDAWKVIYTPAADGAGGEFEAYQRPTDRQERRDLAGTDAAAELRARLRIMTETMQAAQTEAVAGKTPSPGPDEGALRQLRNLGYLAD